MNRIKTSSLASICAILSAGAANQAVAQTSAPLPQVEIAIPRERADPLPISQLAMPGVTLWKDVVYIVREGFRPLTLDLYVPSGKGNRPLVVLMHGGGWSRGNTRQIALYKNFPNILAGLAARGYVVASVNYRLSGEAPSPAQTDDVDAAIVWLKEHADQYGIDPSRSAAWGDSSGGQLSAMTALNCSGADCVTAGVSWYGVYDISMPPNIPYDDKVFATTNAFLGCKIIECPKQAQAASPIRYVKPNPPPMLLIHGSKDFAIPASQAVAMADALTKAGGKPELKIYEGAGHGWMGATPEATLDFHRRAIADTFAFFDRVLNPPR